MKQLDRPLPSGNGRYDEVRFRDALRALGLFPPVEMEDVLAAYKARARRIHPDRFESPEERAHATAKIQEINAARDYVMRHFRGFDLMQKARYRTTGRKGAAPRVVGRWSEWAMLPVTAPYAVATLLVAAPLLIGTAIAGTERSRAWKTRLGRSGAVLWRIWVGLGPHLVVAAVSLAPAPGPFRLWAGLAVLIMASADFATLVTGDANELRRHRPVERARSVAEEAVLPA